MRLQAFAGCLALGFALPALAAERVLTLDPASTSLTFELGATGHNVEGTLELREGTIRFDPESGIASGAVTVDASATDTGNKKRDKTMHGKVLETEQYPLFVFTPRQIQGHLATSGASQFEIKGTLSIHGADHDVVVPTTTEIEGSEVNAKATLSVPFVEWGMHDPSFLFLRVEKVVNVTVTVRGTLSAG